MPRLKDPNIPYGYCHCGCGEQTTIAPYSYAADGWVKGEPLRFRHGHSGRATRKRRTPFYVNRVQAGEVWRLPVRKRGGGFTYALVDADMWPVVGGYWWQLDRDGYAVRTIDADGRRRKMALHRAVMGLKPADAQQVDHINREKLDNRRANLRLADALLQARNVVYPVGTSGVRGVTWNKQISRWQVQVTKPEGGLQYLGCFVDLDDAAKTAREYREQNLPWLAEYGIPA